MSTISYAITAHNEHEELKALLGQVSKYLAKGDEIVVQLDTTATEEVKEVLKEFADKITVIHFPLEKNFAYFKNNLLMSCKCTNIVFLDADEYVSEDFMMTVPLILEANPEVEMYRVPRWNTVEGLTPEHVRKWGWRIDDKGRVNWPDYQGRIMKRESEVKWVGKVHERLEGYKITAVLPNELYIEHHKQIERQENQNTFYDTI